MSDKEYFPAETVAIAFPISGSGSTDFQLINNTSGPQRYLITASQTVFVRRGSADVSAATAADFRVNAGAALFFVVPHGQGVRALANSAAGTLYFGALSK